ncbi:MAG: FeoA family protein [Candidatus Woesearchaeota archaeon]|jgi:Fe2+ transport system protein FeoA|nr:FeoA family protein [Candidatus Woesearchaeota archaeon]
MNECPLSEAVFGENYSVSRITLDLDKPARIRLMEMGVLGGADISIISHPFRNGPYYVRVNDTRYGIHPSYMDHILVENDK